MANGWQLCNVYTKIPTALCNMHLIGNTAVSTVLLVCKIRLDTYEILLQVVMDCCYEIDIYPDPTTIIVDFEQATIKAINNIIELETCTQDCFYYLTQSNWRKIKTLALLNITKRVMPFFNFVVSLTFLPVEDVPAGMQLLRDVLMSQLPC